MHNKPPSPTPRQRAIVRSVCYFDARGGPPSTPYRRPAEDGDPRAAGTAEILIDTVPVPPVVEGELVWPWEDPSVASCGRVLVLGVLLSPPVP